MATDPDARFIERMDLYSSPGWATLAARPVYDPEADAAARARAVAEQLLATAAEQTPEVDVDRVQWAVDVPGRRAPGHREGPADPQRQISRWLDAVAPRPPIEVRSLYFAPRSDVWPHDHDAPVGRLSSIHTPGGISFDLDVEPIDTTRMVQAMTYTMEVILNVDWASMLRDLAASMLSVAPVSLDPPTPVEDDLDRLENTAAGIRARLEAIDEADRQLGPGRDDTTRWDGTAYRWQPGDDVLG